MLKPARPRDEEFLARLREIGPDCCPVVAYGALLPRVALDVPAHGWVNLHFSLLPAWRGAAPVQHAVMAGDEITGASTFLIEEGLDSGPVYGTVTEEVRPTDTSGDLLTRLAFAGSGLLLATMDGIEDGTLKAVPQPADGVTLAPKISVENAHVDWSAPALRVDRVVRGCTPRRVRGPSSAASGSSSYRPRRCPSVPTSPRASCPSGRTTCTSEPVRTPSNCSGSRPRARSRCARRTGHAACVSPPERHSGSEPRRGDRAGARRPTGARHRTGPGCRAGVRHRAGVRRRAEVRSPGEGLASHWAGLSCRGLAPPLGPFVGRSFASH